MFGPVCPAHLAGRQPRTSARRKGLATSREGSGRGINSMLENKSEWQETGGRGVTELCMAAGPLGQGHSCAGGSVPWEALWLPRGIGSQTWYSSLLGRGGEGGVRSVVRRAGVSWVGDTGEGRGREWAVAMQGAQCRAPSSFLLFDQQKGPGPCLD